MTDDKAGTARSVRWEGLGARILSAAVLAPVVLACVWFGGVAFVVLMAVVGVLMAREWAFLVFGDTPGTIWRFLFQAAVAVLCMVLAWTMSVSAAAGVLAMGLLLATVHDLNWTHRTGWMAFGIGYISLPLIAMVLLRENQPHGFLAILWVLLVVWMTDTAAYFVGRAVGGPKLAPRISPKKTWAGLVGGMVGGGITAYLIAIVAELPSPLPVATLGVVAAVVGQGGDMLESGIKRRFGVKDTGNLIPGHGGMLDRADAVMTVVVMAWLVGLARAGAGDEAAGLLIW